MKDNVKKIVAMLLCIAMIAAVAACTPATPAAPAAAEPAAEAPAAAAEPAAEEPAAEAEPVKIVVSVQATTGAEEGWKAVADAYTTMHPNVEVVIDLKPVDGYAEWIQTVFTTEGTEVDIANVNLAGAVKSGKTINYLEYLYNDSPYSDGTWADQFNTEAQVRDIARDEMDSLSLESVQVLWFYNADIFDEVGVQPPTTWAEFVAVCEKLEAAGYQPISIAGDYNSFWSGAMGWLAQIYADQTTRSLINTYRAQEGDYCFDPDVDGVWAYDANDPYNDDSYKVNQNTVRMFKAIKDGTYTADTEGMRTVWNSFAEIFPKYAGGDNFFGTSDAVPMFYQGKAAIMVDGGWRLINFKNDMAKLVSGEEIKSGDVAIEGVQQFRLGTFNMPSMEGAGIEAKARTIEVPTGFLGCIKKDKAHDDAVMDLLMYFSSAEGQGKFLAAGLEVGYVPNGPSLVYGVELPTDIAESFANLSFIGNCQKGYGQKLARGMSGSAGDIDASYRAFYDYSYNFLTGKIGIEDWIAAHQKNILTYLPEAMSTSGVSDADLENPQNAPVGQ